MDNTYGFNSYDAVAKQFQSTAGGGWFRPTEGNSRIRLVSSFGIIQKKWDPQARRSFVLPAGEFGNPEFLMWIIDRKDGLFKIASFTKQIMDSIYALKVNPDYRFDSDIPPYDIIITKVAAGTVKGQDGTLRAKYTYQLTPSRTDTPLTAEETAEFAKCTPIADIIARMQAKAAGTSVPQQAAQASTTVASQPSQTAFGSVVSAATEEVTISVDEENDSDTLLEE